LHQPVFREAYDTEIAGFVSALLARIATYQSSTRRHQGITQLARVNTCGQASHVPSGRKSKWCPCSHPNHKGFPVRMAVTIKKNRLTLPFLSSSFLQAVYAGETDTHDERYDHMKVEIPFRVVLERKHEGIYLITACNS
jgi:hypothetical protein